jgi:hypothetical protein
MSLSDGSSVLNGRNNLTSAGKELLLPLGERFDDLSSGNLTG